MLILIFNLKSLQIIKKQKTTVLQTIKNIKNGKTMYRKSKSFYQLTAQPHSPLAMIHVYFFTSNLLWTAWVNEWVDDIIFEENFLSTSDGSGIMLVSGNVVMKKATEESVLNEFLGKAGKEG